MAADIQFLDFYLRTVTDLTATVSADVFGGPEKKEKPMSYRTTRKQFIMASATGPALSVFIQ